MPPLDQDGPPLSFFEFWSMPAFYGPVALYVLWLMLRHRGSTLPTVANPGLPGGGFHGEEKSTILSLLARAAPDRLAPFTTLDRGQAAEGMAADTEADLATAEAAMRAAGLFYPVVAKPDLGCRGAGVRLIRGPGDLRAYLDGFPVGARLILQRYVGLEAEAGVFYVREPGAERGRILSLTLKYFPHVIGDGRSTLRDLILADPRAGRLPHLYLPRHAARLDLVPRAGEPVRLAFSGSHSKGAIFRDGTRHVTPAMEQAFDAVARGIPGFHFGRFDVRFTSMDDLQAGTGFTILELNGAGAEMTHVWDRSMTLRRAWADIMGQYRLLWRIGAANRDRGHRPLAWRDVWAMSRRESHLTRLYPPTQ
jgi:hypothetical protein